MTNSNDVEIIDVLFDRLEAIDALRDVDLDKEDDTRFARASGGHQTATGSDRRNTSPSRTSMTRRMTGSRRLTTRSSTGPDSSSSWPWASRWRCVPASVGATHTL